MPNLETILRKIIEVDASDVYLTVESPPVYRVEGIAGPADESALTPADTDELARQALDERQYEDFRVKKEANVALALDEGRFRCNVFQQRGATGLVIRQIKTDIPQIDDLGLPEVLREISLTKRGLVLVVGATGSGKSTTLAAMMDHRNRTTPGHIVSIEDPIEYVHDHKKSIITQREVGYDTLSFHDALRNTLRQAPDVILIGEVRDTETMEAAITFAETGHLCLATLHSNNANQAIERILNFFPHERHDQIHLQLSLNLRSVISQRLIQGKDGRRVPAIEILMDTPRVKDLIKKAEIDQIKEAMEQGSQEGCKTFDRSLLELYLDGRIDLEQALHNADSANNLRLAIRKEEAKLGKQDSTTDAGSGFRISGKGAGSSFNRL